MTLTPGAVLTVAFAIALTFLVGALLCCLYRLLRGPAVQDRVMALDCLYINGMLVMLVLGLVYSSATYFEAALLIALLGFTGTLAMAKFLLRGEVIE